MKKNLKMLIITIIVLFATTAQAQGYLTDLNTPNATITKVFTHSNGGVTLFVSGVTPNSDQCGDYSKVHLKGDLAGHEQMVAAALTAFTAGKKVGLYSSGCSLIPFWGGSVTRPIIRDLWISN